jgi:hypothetical protein
MRGQGTSWMPPAGGMVLWEGPSRLDGSLIVALATFRTNNRKTGPMVQTWILAAGADPLAALHSGADVAVCGGCPLRGSLGKNRSCYVNVLKGGPQVVWRSWRAGQYPLASDRLLKVYVAGRPVRLGAYGDPVAVPLGIWTTLLGWAGGHTGYTHQWSRPDSQDYSAILMASVETPEQRREATALGWRTYRILHETERPARGEITCLAAKERRMRTTCAECLLCDGSARTGQRPDIAIRLHGSPPVLHSARRQLTVLNSPSP